MDWEIKLTYPVKLVRAESKYMNDRCAHIQKANYVTNMYLLIVLVDPRDAVVPLLDNTCRTFRLLYAW